MIHINILSLLDKQHKLKLLLFELSERNINIDCVLPCETFLTDNITQLVNIPGFTNVYENRQNVKRGGVGNIDNK